MIQLIYTDYIVGVWMCEQYHLGEVYIFVIKAQEPDEWGYLVKYNYKNQDLNLYMNDNDYKNIRSYKGLSEIDLIKMANKEIDEMAVLFKHNRQRILIGGNIEVYDKISEKNNWLPKISILPKNKKIKSR